VDENILWDVIFYGGVDAIVLWGQGKSIVNIPLTILME